MLDSNQVINSLAVLRKAFEEDEKVVDGLSKVARRYARLSSLNHLCDSLILNILGQIDR